MNWLRQLIHSGRDLPIELRLTEPTAERPFYTLKTSGMSARAMTVPAGMEDLAFAEVCLCLPADGPAPDDDYWPVRLLKAVAHYPHLTKGWIAWGSTVENPKPYDPAGRFIGAFLTAPAKLPLGDEEFTREDGRLVRYLAVVALMESELRFAREHGPEELDERLTRAGVTELIEPGRASVV
jgi:Suppressor of fused protein (SUFU)